MARVDVLMPQMGESIAEGTLSKWLKKLGDEVKRDEPLFEISTDKVDAEIPAPSPPAAVSPPSPTAPSRPLPPTPAPAVKGGDGAETAEERLRRKSTPLVRKIAAEHQVDISTIPGTGFAGRVTKQDILGAIERGVSMPVATPAGTAPRSPLPSAGPVVHPVVEPWPGDRVEPFSKIRKITADHMIMSRRTSAHVTSFFEIDYSRVAELRRKHKAASAERGVNLTYLAFIAKACAENLRKHPVVNAAVSGDNIIYRRDVNIGIAVALDWGLIVPVVKRADELSLGGLARAINDLGERARTKKLSPDEIQRGTFTITNPGVFGSYAGAPIINQPQVAILGVGAIEKRPKVVTLPDGGDTIAIRTMGMLAMSYDHRIVDGADADRFLADVKRTLEDFPEGAI